MGGGRREAGGSEGFGGRGARAEREIMRIEKALA